MWRTIYHGFRRWAKTSTPLVVGYKRTQITVETDGIWVVRKSHATRKWCAECGREVDMVGLKEAADLRREDLQPLTARPMVPSGDTRKWHWSQAPDGSPLLCLESVKSN
jgi:hypothetical protein